MDMENSMQDSDWQAFLYVSGEMTAAQSEAFEARLSLDQSAREAVARAVALTACVQRIGELPSPSGVKAARAIPWARYAVAAGILLAIGLFGMDRIGQRKGAVSTSTADNLLALPTGVVLAWSDLQGMQDGSEMDVSLAATWGDFALDDLDASPSDCDDGLPSWLQLAEGVGAGGD